MWTPTPDEGRAFLWGRVGKVREDRKGRARAQELGTVETAPVPEALSPLSTGIEGALA